MLALLIVLKHLLPDTALATYAYILVTFHLILGFKVLTAEKKGLSLPIGQAILTHLACLGVIVGLAVLRHHIPFFAIIRYFIPGIAPFEANWLFNGEKKIVIAESADALGAPEEKPRFTSTPVSTETIAPIPIAPSLYASSTGEDYDEFLTLMHQGKRPFRKPGISIKEEYELWLAHRARALNPGAAKRPSGLWRFLQVGRNID
jgi:hypothetical protein